MTRNIKKVVSIICVVAMLMSLCVVSMLNQSSAFTLNSTPVGGTLKLDFEDKTGISDGYTRSAANLYVTDPADPDNTVVKLFGNTMAGINVEIGNAGCNTLNGTDAFILQPDTTYMITFKYKFGAGSYSLGANNSGANRLPIQLYTGTQSAYSSAAPKSNLATKEYVIDPATNPQTTTVGSNSTTVNILANDTEWQTFSAVHTTGSTVPKNNLYINMPVNPQTAPYGKITCYLDDIMIDIVDGSDDDGGDLNNSYVFNFKEDATNTYWNPQNHNYLSNSDSSRGKISYVDAEGLHLTVKNQSGSTTTAQWRHKTFVYDKDNGGYFQLKKDAFYYVSVKYKLLEKGSETAVIGLVHTKKTQTEGSDPKIAPDQLGGAMHMLGGISNTSFARHTSVPSGWQYLNVSFTADEVMANTYLAISAHGNNQNANKFLIESVEIREVRTSAGVSIVTYDTTGGNELGFDILAAGTPAAELPIPTHSNANKGFAGWYLDANFTQPLGETIEAGTYTLYAKWSQDISEVTFNNSGEITVVNLAKGTALSNPKRPNSKLFFEGWYSDLAFTNRLTAVPDYDVTLYAKYNYTYIGFNNGGYSDTTLSTTGVVVDPDDSNNNVLALKTVIGSTNNFELANYDAENNNIPYKTPYTNTTYYISFKVKVPAGNKGGRVVLYTGAQSAYSSDASKNEVGGMMYQWSDATGEQGTDWITVTGYYEVDDDFYRERINFTVQDQIYFAYCGIENGKLNTAAGTVYIDDVCVGVYSEEVPAGAVGIYFETNSDKIAPMFGYTGEALVLPEEPKLGGHKFIGWYTDMNFRNKFEATAFGNETVTLYAKWDTVPQTFDFEKFSVHGSTSDRYNYVKDEKNSYIRYNYEQGTSTSPASAVARAFLNSNGATYKVMQGGSYKVTFKYKIEETTGNVTVGAVTHNSSSTWGETKEQNGRLTFSAATNGWETAEFSFTANCVSENATYLSIGVGGDSTILIDDIVVECPTTSANIYGSVLINFNTSGGDEIAPVSGNPGDEIWLPTPKRAGYKFGGWYLESGLVNKFTDTLFGEESTTIYAKWILGKMTEGYEDFPTSAYMGVSNAYTIYYNGSSEVANFDAANVMSGSTSVFRNGTTSGSKGFTLCRDSGLTLGVGERYTMTFYVKPSNVTDPNGVINLLQMSSNTAVSAPDAVETISTVGNLTVGEWQKVTYTFTATEQYVGIQTTEGNDIYFDNFEINLQGYTGTATGDNSVTPIVILMMVVLAAGAMIFTGKKVFSK